MKYSQIQQDQFVISVLNQPRTGTFVDIGCHRPFEISNTLLLEEKGWTGIAMDIVDYSHEWSARKTPFILANALDCEFSDIFQSFDLPIIIDYLSVDLDGKGSRFKAIERLTSTDYHFKVITLEHDVYKKGYREAEQQPQRRLLSRLGYVLVAADVDGGNGLPMEDWWVNTKFVSASQYARFLSSQMSCVDILKQADEESVR